MRQVLVEADAERGREQADAHREDGDDGILDEVDAELLRHREQQRAEQDHGGQALEHAAEDDEHDDGDGEEAGGGRRGGRS